MQILDVWRGGNDGNDLRRTFTKKTRMPLQKFYTYQQIEELSERDCSNL